MARKRSQSAALVPAPRAVVDRLVADLRLLIDQARAGVAQTVNTTLTMLHWQVGRRIHIEILRQQRAEYGRQIVSTVSRQLVEHYGQGFSEKSLRHMIRFAEAFPDTEIVSALARQLTWSHLLAVIYLSDPLQRDFYAQMCRVERWSVRALRQKIDGMLFERTALSKKPAMLARQELAKLREQDRLTPDMVFRDPYFLDFLGLKDTYSESDLEAAILRELEAFVLELGAGFSFIARQKRITIDGDDYYIDLLFFHRRLRRLVAIDLKLGKFQAADKGQMELYLRWLDSHDRQEGEESPLGLILCAGKSDEQIELLQLHHAGIRVAAYLTELPPRPVLQKKLHEAIAMARARLEASRSSRDASGEQAL